MTRALTLPDEWLVAVEDAITHPEKFRFAGYDDSDKGGSTAAVRALRTVVPQFLREQYGVYHDHALEHTVKKGEHEAMALIDFYIILKYRLWRAEYDSRADYLDDVTNQPFSVSRSTIDHAVASIEKRLEAGETLKNIILSLGMSKGAGLRLADIPADKLPGGDINQASEIISSLSPAEAHRYLDDLEQKDVVGGISAIHDSMNNRLILEVRITHPMPQGAKDPSWDRYYITCMDCPKEVALWIMESCHIRMSKREFK